jgi:hypothetical protein
MRVVIFGVILGLGAVVVGKAVPANGAMLGDAPVSFSAERTVTVNGQSYSGRMFHIPGHERHEQDLMGREIFLLDAGTRQAWLLVPSLKTYVDFAFPPALSALDNPDLLRHPLDREQVSGILTTKYRIDYRAADGARAKGFAWISRDGVLMKLAGRLTHPNGAHSLTIVWVLSKLKEGPQDPSLFSIPPGLVELPPGALEPFLGGPP